MVFSCRPLATGQVLPPGSSRRACVDPSAPLRRRARHARKSFVKQRSRVQSSATRTLFSKRTGWRIDGPNGAARVLNLHPSTLRSRMQKLGIRRSAAELS
jgi:transcriptional regulator with GAF, ATPase, and Fis domain